MGVEPDGMGIVNDEIERRLRKAIFWSWVAVVFATLTLALVIYSLLIS